jgi:uncharacterized membrane protein required for colicin V production
LALFIFQTGEIFAQGTTPSYTEPGSGGSAVELNDPLGVGATQGAVQGLIGKIINAVLGLVGSVALAMFIYGGVLWMTAAGSNERVQKGKDVILWATIGLVVIFSAYAIIRFVLMALKGGA